MPKKDKPKKKSGSQAAGERSSVFAFSPFEYVIIGIDTPHKSPADHPRYDPRIHLPLDEMTIRDIRTRGVLEPVLFERDGDSPVIVDGIQRIRHAREAVKRQREAGEVELKVKGLPIRGKDDAHLFGISRAMNAHRTNDGPLENAENAQRMIQMGMSEESIAQTLKVTPQTVKAWLVLLGLAAPVKRAVEAGQISPTAAVELGKLSKDEQTRKLAELTAGGAKPTVRDAANKVRESNGKPVVASPRERIKKAIEVIGGIDEEQFKGWPFSAQAAIDYIRKILSPEKTA